MLFSVFRRYRDICLLLLWFVLFVVLIEVYSQFLLQLLHDSSLDFQDALSLAFFHHREFAFLFDSLACPEWFLEAPVFDRGKDPSCLQLTSRDKAVVQSDGALLHELAMGLAPFIIRLVLRLLGSPGHESLDGFLVGDVHY